MESKSRPGISVSAANCQMHRQSMLFSIRINLYEDYERPVLATSLPLVYFATGSEWAKHDKEASYLSLFQNIALNVSLLPKHTNTKFPKGVPYDYSCPSTKDALADRVCIHCGLYFGSIRSKQNHLAYCRSKALNANDEQQIRTRKVRPQRVAAHHQRELLCAIAFQELEWHAINVVEFDD